MSSQKDAATTNRRSLKFGFENGYFFGSYARCQCIGTKLAAAYLRWNKEGRNSGSLQRALTYPGSTSSTSSIRYKYNLALGRNAMLVDLDRTLHLLGRTAVAVISRSHFRSIFKLGAKRDQCRNSLGDLQKEATLAPCLCSLQPEGRKSRGGTSPLYPKETE